MSNPSEILRRFVEKPPEGWRHEPHGRTAVLCTEGFRRVTYRDRYFLLLGYEIHGGKFWWHLSMSGQKAVPPWDELTAAKAAFIGHGLDAVQILARGTRYVNLHPNCLHLFAPMDGETGLPDFSSRV